MSRFSRWALAASASILLAGAGVPAHAEDPTIIHPLTFGDPAVLPGSGDSGMLESPCVGACGEPMLVVDADRAMYVSAPDGFGPTLHSSPLWRSDDGGESWDLTFPSWAGDTVTDQFTGADTQMVVDARGTLYIGELWYGNDAMHISRDGGDTWTSTPVHHYDLLNDREWLVYSPANDAIYGVYNSLTHLEFVKADLSGPLGDNAALLFFEEKPVGLYGVGVCELEVCELPLVVGPPGWLTVNQQDGSVYLPFSGYFRGREGVFVAVSSDGGETFSYRHVEGSGLDSSWTFVTSAVDSGGTLYVAWAERRAGRVSVYVSISADRGITWRGPFNVSSGEHTTAIFPAMVAGSAGRVAVGWYGTDAAGIPDDLDATASWDVSVAVSIDAASPDPTFEVASVETGFHHGSIWTTSQRRGDRRLLDFFDLDVDSTTGALLAVYARDSQAGTELVFARQSDGCSLTVPGEYIGPGVTAPPGTPATQC